MEKGLITSQELVAALLEQARDLKSGKKTRDLGAILREKGLSAEQVSALLEEDKDRSALREASEVSRTPDPATSERPAPQAEPVRFGKFLLLSELGRGAMGVVHEAQDTELGRRVALKMLIVGRQPDSKESILEEERFLREARLGANLAKHPHIVGICEAGTIDGRHYLAMELVRGRALSEWRKEGSVSIRQLIRVLRDVALAVHHAHQQGVIHRDLKPANILVDEKNDPHVTDFGLAKQLGQDVALSMTAGGMVVGTPGYMSPEQSQGLETIDHRTDIYALGVMLYEMLTGRLPFDGKSAVEILVKAVKDPVVPPSKRSTWVMNPFYFMSLERVCLKALAKNPVDRYASAASMAGDLTKWLEGRNVRELPGEGRRRLLLGVAGGALLALVVGGFALFRIGAGWPNRQEGEQLEVLACSRGRAGQQVLVEGPYIHGKWSGDTQLFWTGGCPKDRLSLRFHSPTGGRRTVILALTKSYDYAIVRCSVNGQVIGPDLDLYSPEVVHAGEKEFPGVEVREGANELGIEIVGTNPHSRAHPPETEIHQVGLDYLIVR